MTAKKIFTACGFAFLCLVVLTGCQGLGSSSAPPPTPTPTPTGSLQSVNHIIFMMQENRSFDAYFGKINDYRASLGLGRDADDLEQDFTNPSDDLIPGTNQNELIRTFHLQTGCIYNTTAAWQAAHGDANRFQEADTDPLLIDGYVHTAAGLAIFDGDADTKGVRSMGYYTKDDLPSPYWFATQFATSDRWYSPSPEQTEDVRLYAMAATSQGLTQPPQVTHTALTAKTIFQLLDAAGISWKIYSLDRQPNGQLITTLRFFQPYGLTKEDHIVPIDQFFTDIQNGTLPQFSYIEPGFSSGRDEHPGKGDQIQHGAAFMHDLLTRFINSPAFKDSVFIETFDESGGLFDHVGPMIDGRPVQELGNGPTGAQAVIAGKYSTDAPIMHVPNPDGIKPRDLRPQDPPDDFIRTGFRVPLIIVSPFAKPHYVSHTPMDYTAVLKFVEKRFNLPNLTLRDAAQPDMDEFFDFANSPNLNPGTPAAQPENLPCNADLASGTAGVPFPQ